MKKIIFLIIVVVSMALLASAHAQISGPIIFGPQPIPTPLPQPVPTPNPIPIPFDPQPVPTPQPDPIPTPLPQPVPTPQPIPVPFDPQPVPTPQPDPIPTPLPQPVPTPNPIPAPFDPQPVPTPQPDPIPTPQPDPIPTPLPQPVPTPQPIPVPFDPQPVPTPQPDPIPTPLPQPVPTPNPIPAPFDPQPVPTPQPDPQPTPFPGDPCDDGLYCNGTETYENGTCVSGSEVVCSSADPCNDGYCDESADRCGVKPKDYGTLCDDGLYCNGMDMCDNGVCAHAGNPCKGNVCDESTDFCGDICTSDQECDDSNNCTDDRCDLASGKCVYTNNHNNCDDGIFCNGDDQCGGGSCGVHSGDSCEEDEVCEEELAFCQPVPDPEPEGSDGCAVTINPQTPKVLLRETMQFSARTTCNDMLEAGSYQWSIESSNGSSIDQATGFYTAGNAAGTDRITVIDTTNDVNATIEVDCSPLWPMAYGQMWGKKKGENLLLLRTFRDEIMTKTKTGKSLITMLYNNSLEIAWLLIKNPTLRQESSEMVDYVRYGIQQLLVDDEMEIDIDTIAKAVFLLDRFEAKAGPKLKAVIQRSKEILTGKEVYRELGIIVSE